MRELLIRFGSDVLAAEYSQENLEDYRWWRDAVENPAYASTAKPDNENEISKWECEEQVRHSRLPWSLQNEYNVTRQNAASII